MMKKSENRDLAAGMCGIIMIVSDYVESEQTVRP